MTTKNTKITFYYNNKSTEDENTTQALKVIRNLLLLNRNFH